MSRKKFRGWCTNGCGDEIKQGSTKYCSRRCQHAFHYKQRSKLLELGQYRQVLSRSQFIRRYLVDKLGEKCSRCGWSERHSITGNIPIEVEHIDGDWRNNAPQNLTLLCPSCHSLTPTYRALNRGQGRAHRFGGANRPERNENAQPSLGEVHYREVIEARSKQLGLF